MLNVQGELCGRAWPIIQSESSFRHKYRLLKTSIFPLNREPSPYNLHARWMTRRHLVTKTIYVTLAHIKIPPTKSKLQLERLAVQKMPCSRQSLSSSWCPFTAADAAHVHLLQNGRIRLWTLSTTEPAKKPK